MKNYLLSIFMLLGVILTAAPSLRFKHVVLPDVNDNTISSIVEDDNGFMWFGTYSGLIRYDGFSSLRIPKIGDDGVHSFFSRIESLLIDDATIWIATQRGVFLYDIISETTSNFKQIPFGTACRCLYKTRDGNVVIGTDKGLYIYYPKEEEIEVFVSNAGEESGISNNIVRCIYEDENNDLWIGTFDQLNKFDIEERTFTHFNLQKNDVDTRQNNLILSITPQSETSDSVLFVGTEAGVCVFNTRNAETTYFQKEVGGNSLSSDIIKSSQRIGGNIWLGTAKGLNLVDVSTGEFSSYYHEYNNTYSISSNVIHAICKDSRGYVWLGTENGVDQIFVDNELIQINKTHSDAVPFKGGAKFNGFIEDTEGNFFFATSDGVYKYTDATGDWQHYSPPAILHNKVSDLLLRDDKLWLTTAGGLNIYDLKEDVFYSYNVDATKKNWLYSNYLSVLMKDDDGSVYLGSYKTGLYEAHLNDRQLPERFTNFSQQTREGGMTGPIHVIDFFLDSKDRICSRSSSRINQLNKASGIFETKLLKGDHSFCCIVQGDEDVFWLGTSTGVAKFNSEDNSTHDIINIGEMVVSLYAENNFLLIATTKNLYKYLIEEDEIIKISPQKLELRDFVSDFYKSKSGSVFLGCKEGFLSFFPENIHPDTLVSEVSFSEFKIHDKLIKTHVTYGDRQILKRNVNNTAEIELNHRENSFSVSLLASDLSNDRFHYILEGYDNLWHSIPEGQNVISYTKIPPGKYTLKVKATNKLDDAKVRSLKIRITPPFYNSITAYFLYFLFCIALLLFLRKILLVRVEYRDNLKAEKIQREKTEELVQAKSRFFTNVSHELRTPLTLILSPVERLIAIEEDEGKVITLQVIKRNSERLIRLVNQILDLRKIEKNLEALRIQQYDIMQFCSAIFLRFSEEAKYRNLKMTFSSDASSFMLWYDLEKMEKILDNMLSNAMKFTQDGGAIQVEVLSKQSDLVTIKITDTGIGISSEEQEHIFERFFNITRNNFSRQKGTGIGLSLVNEYVKMHDGEIALVSQPNEGSAFSLSFPKDKHRLEKYELVEEVEEFEVSVSAQEKVESIDEKSGQESILIVDDEPELLAFLKDCFSQYYKIYTATDGVEAWKSVVNHIPDLVVSDIVMPNMTGIELCQKVKSDVRVSHIPVVLLTAKGDLESKLLGVKTGADDYISKPFSMDYLLLRVEKIIEQRKILQRSFMRKQKLEPSEVDVKSVDDGFLEKLMQIVEAEISNTDLNAKMLSLLVGLSYNNLYRKVKSLTGQSINEFIRSVRLQRAAQLLMTDTYNVTEVMGQVGFTHNSYFTKVFKDAFGMTPREYKKHNRADSN